MGASFDLDIVSDHVTEFIDAKNAATRRALEIIGIKAEGYAKPMCPVDTGLLRNSITHATGGGNTAQQAYKDNAGNQSGQYSGKAPDEKNTVFVGTNVEYAPYVEMGSRGRKAKPYLKPAIQGHVQEYKGIWEKELKGG